jgi:hypothetical protein
MTLKDRFEALIRFDQNRVFETDVLDLLAEQQDIYMDWLVAMNSEYDLMQTDPDYTFGSHINPVIAKLGSSFLLVEADTDACCGIVYRFVGV